MKGLEYGELTELLKDTEASFTVFAPVDQAFNKLPVWQFDAIFDKSQTVKMVRFANIIFSSICNYISVKNVVLYRAINTTIT